MRKPVDVGEAAPDFTLRDEAGNTVTLSDFKGKKNVVLFFYPKASTYGCTKEACSFRDSFTRFPSDTVVFGISTDTAADQKKFKDEQNLQYSLLCDDDSTVRELFGVPGSLFGLLPGRVTYVLDKQGIVRGVYNSQVFFSAHPQKALETLAALGSK